MTILCVRRGEECRARAGRHSSHHRTPHFVLKQFRSDGRVLDRLMGTVKAQSKLGMKDSSKTENSDQEVLLQENKTKKRMKQFFFYLYFINSGCLSCILFIGKKIETVFSYKNECQAINPMN